jgi:hypothetical protein
LWIVISLIGGAVGLAIGMLAAESIPNLAVGKPISRGGEPVVATSTVLSVATTGLLFGLLLGLLQWSMLRQRVSNAAWWIAANAGGWAVGFGLAAQIAGDSIVGWFLSAGSINGLITGWLLQRWVNN